MFDALSEALGSLDGLDALDAVETLEQAGEVQRNINLAQAELLKIACHWADLNATLDHPHAANLPGTEQLVRLGGAGTPEMAEFASAELGAQLQMSAGGCKMLIADALDLRHRLPLLWALVCLGDVKPYVARQIAQRTRHLGQGPVAIVDQKAARYATTLPWGRLAAVVDAAVMAADPEQAERDAQDARTRQGVWVGRDTDHGYKKMFIRAAGPDVESFDALVDEVARALDLLGDTDSIDVRRAKAIGIIASTQATQELFALAGAREDEADSAETTPDKASDRRRLERARAIGSAVVYLHLSQDAVSGSFGVGRLEGLGPVTSTQVREFLGHRNVTVKPVIDGVARPNQCLSDFIAPKSSGIVDYIGMFAVTAGIGIEKYEKRFEDAHDDYSSIMLKSLADRLAEAFAEQLHERVRRDLWGYAADETLDNVALIREEYKGVRPAPGYPACPEHTVKADMFRVLQAEEIGMQITESYAMYPGAAVSGFYLAHPDSKYFSVGKIGMDQVENMAVRRGVAKEQIERWLAPNL